jgi:hypothetical protein
MGEHAELGKQPSAAKRSLNCPDWANLAKSLGLDKEDEAGPDAWKGTIAHYLAEICLINGRHPLSYEGYTGVYDTKLDKSWLHLPTEKRLIEEAAGNKAFFVMEITDDVAIAVAEYTELVRSDRATAVHKEFRVESRVYLDWIVPGWKGTLDSCVIEPLSRLYIHDYKNGFVYVPVDDDPETWPQGALYAAGVLGPDNKYGISEVVATVVQPNAMGKAVHRGVYSVDTLMKWINEVFIPRVNHKEATTHNLIAGPWCKFCPVAKKTSADGGPLCPAHRKEVQKALPGADFLDALSSIAAPPALLEKGAAPGEMSAEKMDRILTAIPFIKDYIAAVEKEAYDRLQREAPNAPTTRRLAEGGLSNRAWKSENEVAEVFSKVLGDKIWQRKLNSPAQMEKALKKEGNFKSETINVFLKERTRGPAVMVPIDDPRPSATSKFDELFQEIEE